ncbi:MAG: ABC transporter permease [Tannerella sp.]|jgi:putative ABC transport system permease protein|nr:ABC transporter permease [Tannerella sp.]
MNIFNSHKRNRFFLWVNITGLAIGLAASIMLILFVVNEWSYDRHFTNHERIVRLLTIRNADGNLIHYPINLRKAYTELPDKVPGVEAATQVYGFLGRIEVINGQKRFQNVYAQLADPEFFKVFQMKFIQGTPETSLVSPNAAVLTRRYADIIFGSPEAAMNQQIIAEGINLVVTGVVEELPKNTHFNFDILGSTKAIPWLNEAGGLEFLTYYLIQKEANIPAVRAEIENAYRPIIKPWGEVVGDPNAYGETEMLSDIHLKSKTYGAAGNLRFIWILTGLAFFILLLAITNFINLFVTRGEMRMAEIGIRKANGAQIFDIVRQFFSEVAMVVLVAFGVGLFLAILCTPYFGALINKNLDLIQLLNPTFIVAMILLFILTVVLSAFYPAIYLSRFSPLDILNRRIRFSKRRLTAGIVIFQSVISIVLLSVILVLYKQTSYLQQLPLGYNPENVLMASTNETVRKSYHAIRQELLQQPEIKAVSIADHIVGMDGSGQVIAHRGENDQKGINEYRLAMGMPDLMGLELVEGRFWQESDPDSVPMLILNEAAVKMLGGESPIEKTYAYNGEPVQVIGVVKDFYYSDPASEIAPIALMNQLTGGYLLYIRFNETANPVQAQQVTLNILRKFDPDFVLDPIWSTDIYQAKFGEIKTLTRTILMGSAMSIFVAMLGLLAIHLYSAFRRTKEIGIRRIHGARKDSVFLLLSFDVLKWIGLAALFAIPAAVYVVSEMLNNYTNHTRLDWMVFALPVLIQCVIALITTSGVTVSVLSRNPVKSLKTE